MPRKKVKKEHINPTALGMALGVTMIAGIGFMWLIANLLGLWTDGVAMIGQFYLGFDVTLVGLVLGSFWGFFDGFIGGWVIGWLYNKFAH